MIQKQRGLADVAEPDGKTRDVTAEAFVESGNGDVAKVEGGLVENRPSWLARK